MPIDQQERVRGEIETFVAYALEPGQVPPASIDFVAKTQESGGLTVTVSPLRPEEAAWNQWPGDGPRLFNNRMAHLYSITVKGPPPLVWIAEATQLELNSDAVRLPAATGPDELIGDLLYWALQQERWVLDGDLVDRTRGAGGFRSAYLPHMGTGETLRGIVAFPTFYLDGDNAPQNAGHMHVVAERLTVVIESGEDTHKVVFVYD